LGKTILARENPVKQPETRLNPAESFIPASLGQYLPWLGTE
jgi:hypothetical protein